MSLSPPESSGVFLLASSGLILSSLSELAKNTVGGERLKNTSLKAKTNKREQDKYFYVQNPDGTIDKWLKADWPPKFVRYGAGYYERRMGLA